MTESELMALESRVHRYGFDGADPVDILALIDEVRRLRVPLERVEYQLDCWLDLPTRTRRSDLLEYVRAALDPSPAPDCADVV